MTKRPLLERNLEELSSSPKSMEQEHLLVLLKNVETDTMT